MNGSNEGPGMTGRKAIEDPAEIVEALARGRDPRTGKRLAGEGWSDPDVIRALFAAAAALRSERRRPPRSESTLPPAAGKPWTPEEEARLKSEFGTTTDLGSLAERHARTRGAISARLVRLGLLPPDGGTGGPR